MRAITMGLVVVAGAVMPAGAARAADRAPQPLTARVLVRGVTYGPVADGRRFAAGSTTSTVGVVVDDSGKRPVSRSYPCPLGPPLGSPLVSRAVGDCEAGPRVVDLRSLASAPIPGMTPMGAVGGEVGATWITGSVDDHRTLVNWHTGAQRPLNQRDDRNYDLDQPTPKLRVLAVGTTLLDRPDGRSVSRKLVDRIAFRQAGRTITIRRQCDDQCSGITYAGGVISWSEAQSACAYVVRTRREGCWTPTVRQLSNVQQGGIGADPVEHMPVSHTAHGLFITFPERYKTDDFTYTHELSDITYYVSLAKLLHGG